MENSGVYLIINKINSKIYIGSTVNFKDRWYKHLSGKGNTHLFNSFKKYGVDNFEFKILEKVDISQNRTLLYEIEQKWMDFYDIKNSNTYNVRFTAIPNMTEKRDNSFKEKMREIRLKLAIGAKPVNQYSFEGILIKRWNSSSEIERVLKFRARNIVGACKGEQHTAFGFIWRFDNEPLDEKFLEKIKNKRPKNKKVIQKSLNNEIINVFDSMKDASNVTGFNYSRIGVACNKKTKYNGFYWEFTKSPTFS
jgi:group I intron endonuclease